jgi:hypothetical protein
MAAASRSSNSDCPTAGWLPSAAGAACGKGRAHVGQACWLVAAAAGGMGGAVLAGSGARR